MLTGTSYTTMIGDTVPATAIGKRCAKCTEMIDDDPVIAINAVVFFRALPDLFPQNAYNTAALATLYYHPDCASEICRIIGSDLEALENLPADTSDIAPASIEEARRLFDDTNEENKQ